MAARDISMRVEGNSTGFPSIGGCLQLLERIARGAVRGEQPDHSTQPKQHLNVDGCRRNNTADGHEPTNPGVFRQYWWQDTVTVPSLFAAIPSRKSRTSDRQNAPKISRRDLSYRLCAHGPGTNFWFAPRPLRPDSLQG